MESVLCNLTINIVLPGPSSLSASVCRSSTKQDSMCFDIGWKVQGLRESKETVKIVCHIIIHMHVYNEYFDLYLHSAVMYVMYGTLSHHYLSTESVTLPCES